MEAVLQEREVNFTVPQQQLVEVSRSEPEALARRLAERLYANPDSSQLEAVFRQIEATKKGRSLGATYLITALTAPAYHLC